MLFVRLLLQPSSFPPGGTLFTFSFPIFPSGKAWNSFPFWKYGRGVEAEVEGGGGEITKRKVRRVLVNGDGNVCICNGGGCRVCQSVSHRVFITSSYRFSLANSRKHLGIEVGSGKVK